LAIQLDLSQNNKASHCTFFQLTLSRTKVFPQ
jgi:hypothetical protein